MVRRVAVVGAGSSGLVCIKSCVEEGLEPVCFESSDDIGGLWRFKVSGRGTVLKNIQQINVVTGQNDRKVDYFISSVSCFPLCPQESPESERSSIYRSLVCNTSKEIMCFSDFPMPADYPNYMHHSQLLQYFRLYAEHFDLLRYINFQVIPISSC